MASKLWDRLAHHKEAVAKVPVLNVDISAAALLIHLDAASLRTVLGLTASVLHFFQYRDYRRSRPQANLLPNPLSYLVSSAAEPWLWPTEPFKT